MIPLRLELTNFLAYRSPAPLDFTGLHVAVLCGDNGAGKSSLLDAITWALWGRARAKTDAELVHQSQNEMRVEFTFKLGAHVYRVIRAKRAKGSAVLDFQMRSEQGQWQSIGEATVPKTQQKITATLRMEYETFTHSAYLMQGHADEFTSKPPTKRKEVLADILQLQRWEKFEQRAKEKIAAIDKRLGAIDLTLNEIEDELARRPVYQSELTEAQTQVIAVGERLRQAEAGWAQIDAARQAMAALERQLDDLQRRLREAEREVVTLEADIEVTQKKADGAAIERELRLAHNRLAELTRLEAEQAQLTEARQRMGELSAGLTEQNKAVETQANDLKKQIDLVRAEGDRARKQLQNSLAEAEQASRKQLDTLKGDYERYRTKRLAEVDAEVQRIDKRVVALRAAAEPHCPTCGQALDEAARAELVATLEAEIATRKEQGQREVHDEAQVYETRLLETSLEQKKRRTQIEAALNTEDSARAAQAAELETQVTARREQYRQNLEQLKVQTAEQARLDKDLAQVAEQLRAKPTVLQAVADWQAAQGQAAEAQTRLAALQERRQRWQAALATDAATRTQLEAEAATHAAILRDAAARQKALDTLRHEDTLAKARLGAAQQKLAALESQEKQREAKRNERIQLANERGLYEELREAFGKKGIPALMIESAVPEIEAAANRLLGRMTAGRMHLRFNTQRETQAGETRETLDIHIADELGTRAYELYSGGEAFRINFAIRVALSQLLARRAGTQLQTLIVDEGFGALDAQGREHLVEAIHQVQDDFKCVLVVTHIEELKDAFPARIEIVKRPDGSEIFIR